MYHSPIVDGLVARLDVAIVGGGMVASLVNVVSGVHVGIRASIAALFGPSSTTSVSVVAVLVQLQVVRGAVAAVTFVGFGLVEV